MTLEKSFFYSLPSTQKVHVIFAGGWDVRKYKYIVSNAFPSTAQLVTLSKREIKLV